MPREFFARDAPVPRLTQRAREDRPAERCRHRSHAAAALQRGAGGDVGRGFRRARAGRALRAREVWVGADFRFGHARARRSRAAASESAKRDGFSAEAIDAGHCVDGERVSSRAIRAAACGGDFAAARDCSDARSRSAATSCAASSSAASSAIRPRTCGSAARVSPVSGIFAVRVHGVERRAMPASRASASGRRGWHRAVARSAPVRLRRRSLRKRIEVEFVAKLRDEEKFDGPRCDGAADPSRCRRRRAKSCGSMTKPRVLRTPETQCPSTTRTRSTCRRPISR